MKTVNRTGMLVLLGVLGAGLAGAAPELVTVAEVSAFEKSLEVVRKHHFDMSVALEEKFKDPGNDDAAEALAVSLRRNKLAFLRSVMLSERDLLLLAEPEDRIDEREVREVNSADRALVADLRQKIRDADRKRIRAGLGDEIFSSFNSARTDYEINRDEIELDRLFARKTGRLRSALARARREVARESARRRTDDERVGDLQKEIDEMEEVITGIRCFIYGYAPGAGFEEPAGADESPAGKLRARLVAERDRLLAELRSDGEKGVGVGKAGGVVGGVAYGSDIGVILQVYYGMEGHAESLRKEIGDKYAGAHYREVGNPTIRVAGILHDLTNRKNIDPLLPMEELIVVCGVKKLHWFSDLHGRVYYGGIRHLRYLLRRGGVEFHVKSMDKQPREDLGLLITDFQN